MRDQQIINGFTEHDRVINLLHKRLGNLEKAYDKLYLNQLTQQMMWDCLMGILSKKGIVTQPEFDAGLEALKVATQAAMEADAKKKAEAEDLSRGKITVLSQTPAIPVS